MPDPAKIACCRGTPIAFGFNRSINFSRKNTNKINKKSVTKIVPLERKASKTATSKPAEPDLIETAKSIGRARIA